MANRSPGRRQAPSGDPGDPVTTLIEAMSPPPGCPICGSTDCNALRHAESAFTADWSLRRLELVAGPGSILAPHRVFEAERLIYGQGDPIPYAEAVRLGRLGLIPPVVEPTPAPPLKPAPVLPDELAAARTAARARRQPGNRQTGGSP